MGRKRQKDICGIELPPPARKTIDLEGRVVKDGVKKALRERQDALSELVAIFAAKISPSNRWNCSTVEAMSRCLSGRAEDELIS
jgi:hypothetical protein